MTKFCKDCNNRKDKKCTVTGAYTPRKRTCQEFKPKK